MGTNQKKILRRLFRPGPFEKMAIWGVHHFDTVFRHMGVSKNRGTPKWMVKNGKPLLTWMIWGENPLFSETSISWNFFVDRVVWPGIVQLSTSPFDVSWLRWLVMCRYQAVSRNFFLMIPKISGFCGLFFVLLIHMKSSYSKQYICIYIYMQYAWSLSTLYRHLCFGFSCHLDVRCPPKRLQESLKWGQTLMISFSHCSL